MISELLTAFRESSFERIRNPLLGSYAVFFVARNWRALFVAVAGDVPLEQRIALINKEALPWPEAVGLPAVLALLYVILMPWIAYGIQRLLAPSAFRRKSHRIVEERRLAQLRRQVVEDEVAAARIRDAAMLKLEEQRKDQEFKFRQREWELEEKRLNVQNNQIIADLRRSNKSGENEARKLNSDLKKITQSLEMANKRFDSANSERQQSLAALQQAQTRIKDLEKDLDRHKAAGLVSSR